MTKSTITREQLEEWVAQFDEDGGCDATDRQLEALIRQSLAAMDQKPALHRYRRKAVEPYGPYPWHYEVFVDYPRPVECIEDEYFYAAPVVPLWYVMVPACLLSELRDWAHPEIEDYCDMWAGRRDDEFPALRKIIADADALLAAADCSIPMISDRWIPVSERMPEDEQEVLTINRMGHRFVSFFDKHSGLFFDRLDAPAACCIEHVLVTHWMPLPEPPQEVK